MESWVSREEGRGHPDLELIGQTDSCACTLSITYFFRYRGFSILPSKVPATILHSSTSSRPAAWSSSTSSATSAKTHGRSAVVKRLTALPNLELSSIGQHPSHAEVSRRLEATDEGTGEGPGGGGQLRPPSQRTEAGGGGGGGGRQRRPLVDGGGFSEVDSRKVTPETELPRLIGTKSQVVVDLPT